MNIDQLRQQFPEKYTSRRFFESARCPNGSTCPQCGYNVSYVINVRNQPTGRYKCKKCNRQFTVTTKIALHRTKLSPWKWLQAMYLMLSSSKGISSVVLARLLRVSQQPARKMRHAIRKMMDSNQSDFDVLRYFPTLSDQLNRFSCLFGSFALKLV